MTGPTTGPASASTITSMWSVDLREFGARGAILDSRGRWFAVSGTTLVSFTVDGRSRWEAPYLGAPRGPLAVTPDGSLLRIEGDELVTRDGESGRVLGSFRAPPAHSFSLDPWNGILFVQTVFDQAGHGGRVVHRTDRTGAPSWSVSLPAPAWEFPTMFGDVVLVQSGGLLRALDSTGQVRWAAGHDGFHPPQTATREPDVADTLWLPPRQAGGALLVGFGWYSGNALFLVDPQAQTVTRYGGSPVPRSPVTVLPSDGGFRVAMRGSDRELRRLEYEYSVVALDETGELLWQHWLHAPMAALTAGVDGAVIVAGTPDRRRWDLYHPRQDLSRDTYVRCLGRDGSPRWTWFAPGPQERLPWLGSDGLVHLISEGQLVTLPGS